MRRYIRFTNVPEYFPARAMMNRSNWTEAERLLRLSIAKSPGSARFHACLGRVLCQQDRWPEAGEAFSTAIALDGGRDGYHGDLARVQLRSDPAAALRAFGFDPSHPRVRVRVLESPHDVRRYDLFVNLSHFTVLPPWARRNLLVVFFPELHSEWIAKYDAVVTISRFSADWITRYCGVTHHVIAPPPIDATRFAPAVKEPLIVSVGRFF